MKIYNVNPDSRTQRYSNNSGIIGWILPNGDNARAYAFSNHLDFFVDNMGLFGISEDKQNEIKRQPYTEATYCIPMSKGAIRYKIVFGFGSATKCLVLNGAREAISRHLDSIRELYMSHNDGGNTKILVEFVSLLTCKNSGSIECDNFEELSDTL